MGCRYNLTQPAFTPYTAVQGAGWCIGDLQRLAYTRLPATTVAGASSSPILELALNSSTLPPLWVAVTVPGRGVVVPSARVSGDGAATAIPLGHSAALPIGEHPILITPTPDSIAGGWCGSMTRFLRIAAAGVPGPSSVAPLGLLPDQPISFFDDHFVSLLPPPLPSCRHWWGILGIDRCFLWDGLRGILAHGTTCSSALCRILLTAP